MSDYSALRYNRAFSNQIGLPKMTIESLNMFSEGVASRQYMFDDHDPPITIVGFDVHDSSIAGCEHWNFSVLLLPSRWHRYNYIFAGVIPNPSAIPNIEFLLWKPRL